jgi:hypothetical protein
MKQSLFIAVLACLVLAGPARIFAQTNAPDAAATAAASIEKQVKQLSEPLQLTDAAKAAKVHDILFAHYQTLRAWHATNDAQIKEAWGGFNKARSAKNVADANAALDKISGFYASFQPEHKKFLADLGTLLTPEQVEAIKDKWTINKVEVTYKVYLQIFPTLTDAQKAVVLQDLKDAREEAIDCDRKSLGSKSFDEISSFFKKYKIKIEDDYLTSQGYTPQQARKDFAAKQKAGADAEK